MLRRIIQIKNNLLRRLLLDRRTLSLIKYKYSTYYSKQERCELSELCSKYTSDKGYVQNQDKIDKNFKIHNYHNYSDYYSEIFSLNRNNIKKVFELGIGNINKENIHNMNMLGNRYSPGASLKVWRDYFKDAKIYGADHDKSALFNEERIKTYYVDQANTETILEMWKKINEKDFDIIIDDGCHRYEETINFFENSKKFLKSDGIYIIEDIIPSQRKKFLKYFKNKNYDFKFIHFSRPEGPNDVNSLITLRNLQVKLKIKLELFGVSRDFSDKDHLEFEIKDKSSVNDLRNEVIKYIDKNFGGNENFIKIVKSSAFCSETNCIVSDNYKITKNEKIAIIPPIGGG